jgi:hypothetical protein
MDNKKRDWASIWTKIGQAFETPYEKRTKRQCNLTMSGLCFALSRFTRDIKPYKKLSQVVGLRGHTKNGYWWLCGNNQNDLQRALFAYFMAAIGNKEFQKLWDEAGMDKHTEQATDRLLADVMSIKNIDSLKADMLQEYVITLAKTTNEFREMVKAFHWSHHRGGNWRTCDQMPCTKYRVAIERAERLLYGEACDD